MVDMAQHGWAAQLALWEQLLRAGAEHNLNSLSAELARTVPLAVLPRNKVTNTLWRVRKGSKLSMLS
jgi:hypothetical protein